MVVLRCGTAGNSFANEKNQNNQSAIAKKVKTNDRYFFIT